jgi:hypothetical protein
MEKMKTASEEEIASDIEKAQVTDKAAKLLKDNRRLKEL